jgi:hypothetical protein
MNRRRFSRQLVLALLAVATPIALSACGDDTNASSSPGSTAPGSTVSPEAPLPVDVVELTMTDFSYGEVPEQVAPGTSFAIRNSSSTELHELVAVRLPDEETRPLAELVASDVGAIFATPPTFVVLSPPGAGTEEQIVAVGDATLVEPGRYALICMIPTGADPAEYLAAAAESTDGPPQVEGGPPHAVHGMWAEVVVG